MALTRRGTRKRNSILAGIRSAIGRTGGGAVNPGYSIAFQALSISPSDNSIQDVATGTGSLTTTHADTLYGKQADGVYYPFAANEPVYTGGRVVTNYVYPSLPGSTAPWDYFRSQYVGINSGVGPNGQDATEILFDSTVSTANHVVSDNNSSFPANYADLEYTTRFWIRTKSGSGARTILVGVATSNTPDMTSVDIDETWKLISVYADASSHASTADIQFSLKAEDVSTTWSIEICDCQTEIVTHRKDKETPSEYIPTTTAAVTKVFNTAGWKKGSPNAVVDNVVTENARKVTNQFTYSEDFSNAAWGKSNVTVTHGIDDPNGGTTATRVEATATNGGLTQNFAHTTGSYPINSYWLRRVSGTGSVNIMTGSTSFTDISGELTTEWKRFAGSTLMTDANARGGIFIGTSGDIVDIAFAQGEKETDRIDQTNPSEYVPKDAYQPDLDILPSNYLSADPWTDNTAAGEFTATGSSLEFNFDTGFASIEMPDMFEIGEDYIVEVDVTHISGEGVRIDFGTVQAILNSGSTTGTVTGYATANNTYLRVANGISAAAEFTITGLRISKVSSGTEAKTGGNPNTVASNVVTEGTAPAYPHNVDTYGSPFNGLWLQYLPGATNELTYSRSFGSWVLTGTPTVSLDETGLDGTANTSGTITDDDGSGVEGINADTSGALTADTNEYTSVVYIKKDTNTSRFVGIRSYAINGTSVNVTVLLNTATGEVTDALTVDTPTATEVFDDGDYWKVFTQFTNNNNTRLLLFVYPAYSSSWSSQVNTTGSCVVGNAEFYKKTIAEVRGLSPIFTTTAAVTVARTDYEFDGSNLIDTLAFHCEYMPSSDGGTSGTGYAYLGFESNNNSLWFTNVNRYHANYSNGASTNYDLILSKDTKYSAGAVFSAGDNLKGVFVDGTEGDTTTHTNFTTKTKINVGHTGVVPFKVRDYRIYSIDNYAKGKSLIENLA